MAEFEIVERAAQPTAVVRAKASVGDLPSFLGRAFGAVWQALEAQGVAPAGEPFAYYNGAPDPEVEVEAGFPVSRPCAPSGEVVPGELPGGQALTGVHVGPYERLVDTYTRLRDFAAERGLRLRDGMWEVYLSDPAREPDSSTWRTLIVWPVETIGTGAAPTTRRP